jgi:hypothetical protein
MATMPTRWKDPMGSRFPFRTLPTDVQLLVLGALDLHTLKSVSDASPDIKLLYLSCPSGLLQGVLTSMEHQTENLILTIFSLIRIMRSGGIYPLLSISCMQHFLAECLDCEEVGRIAVNEHDAFDSLDLLCEVDAEIGSLVQDYAAAIYIKARAIEKSGAASLPLPLSATERYRMRRAFYRLKLFSVLFYYYADHIHFELDSSYNSFLDRLSTFELDELVTVYQWMYLNGRSFRPAHGHTDCSPPTIGRWRNHDPLNCRRMCMRPRPEIDGSIHPRPTQPLWDTLVVEYHVRFEEPWAKPSACRATPIKQWDDFPKANEPNTGWLRWRQLRDSARWYPDYYGYTRHFLCLGYCFWDRDRLERWGDMFSKAWLAAERAGHIEWCDDCEVQCKCNLCSGETGEALP